MHHFIAIICYSKLKTVDLMNHENTVSKTLSNSNDVNLMNIERRKNTKNYTLI